ncbi:unnamed protein product [Meloidogyne enterolobii]|uniref:Uncharacterized protein n=1 Tax=Meloidogyne enterolobii TaxID=390850 RepID=A0ACB1A934_MELEN
MSLEGKTHEGSLKIFKIVKNIFRGVQLLKDSTGPHVTLTLKRDSSASPLLRNTAETSPVSDHVTVFKVGFLRRKSIKEKYLYVTYTCVTLVNNRF